MFSGLKSVNANKQEVPAGTLSATLLFLFWALSPSRNARQPKYPNDFPCLFCLPIVLPNVSEEKVSPTRARNMKDFENVSEDSKSSSCSKNSRLLPPCSQSRRELLLKNCLSNVRGWGGRVIFALWWGFHCLGPYL